MSRSIETLCAALCLGSVLCAQAVVSPADRGALEGSSFTHYPLGRADHRLQQIHGDLPPGTTLLGHAYRADAVQIRSRVAAFTVDLQVTASVAARAPAQASTTFATNEGPSPIVVLPRTVLSFPATDRPGMDPAPTFEFVIPWQVPFLMPAQGGALCLDLRVFGNTTQGGNDRNFSVYLDAHESHSNGNNEQVGYRDGQGCAAPGRTALAYASFSMWHLGTGSQFDIALRNGIPDDGTGRAMAFFMAGVGPAQIPWLTMPGCDLLTTNEVWWGLGPTDGQGNFTGNLPLPVLPSGHRIYLQSGSAHLGTGELAFGDRSTLVSPPPGPAVIPAARVANASNGAGITGTVSFAPPVTRFL